jgi:hypothetical protein
LRVTQRLRLQTEQLFKVGLQNALLFVFGRKVLESTCGAHASQRKRKDAPQAPRAAWGALASGVWGRVLLSNVHASLA